MTRAMELLALNQCQHREISDGRNPQATSVLKEQLLKEVRALEKQAKQLQLTEDGVDFSMIQTYREMISSREKLFTQLMK
ncbi:MAG: hypothetical protein ACI92E_000374 [Oceanicoccus sp.]|jgi:hypothetical protein